MDTNSVLAVIPARGGSVRLPRKNILPLLGKPLISWTIEEAMKSKSISKVVVSTDDEEISIIARESDADVPFLRPQKLATNTATTIDVVIHAIEFLEKAGEKYKYVAILQPTSPLRKAYHIDAAMQLLLAKNADAIVSVSKLGHPIEWCNGLPSDLSMDNFFAKGVKNKRSQDFAPSYRPNGCIFIVNVEKMLQERELFFTKNIYAYIMDEKYSIDIDTEIDFHVAECMMSYI